MAVVIDGKQVAQSYRLKLKEEVARLKEERIQPKLTVILIGEDPASQSYVRGKEKAAQEIGMDSDLIRLSEETKESELLHLIERLNADASVHGLGARVFAFVVRENAFDALSDTHGFLFLLGLRARGPGHQGRGRRGEALRAFRAERRGGREGPGFGGASVWRHRHGPPGCPIVVTGPTTVNDQSEIIVSATRWGGVAGNNDFCQNDSRPSRNPLLPHARVLVAATTVRRDSI